MAFDTDENYIKACSVYCNVITSLNFSTAAGPASASILARVEFNETLLSIHDHSLQPQEHNLEATVVVQNEDVVIHSDNVAEPAEPILAGVEFLEHPNDDQEKQGAVSLEASTEIDGEDHGEL